MQRVICVLALLGAMGVIAWLALELGPAHYDLTLGALALAQAALGVLVIRVVIRRSHK